MQCVIPGMMWSSMLWIACRLAAVPDTALILHNFYFVALASTMALGLIYCYFRHKLVIIDYFALLPRAWLNFKANVMMLFQAWLIALWGSRKSRAFWRTGVVTWPTWSVTSLPRPLTSPSRTSTSRWVASADTCPGKEKKEVMRDELECDVPFF